MRNVSCSSTEDNDQVPPGWAIVGKMRLKVLFSSAASSSAPVVWIAKEITSIVYSPQSLDSFIVHTALYMVQDRRLILPHSLNCKCEIRQEKGSHDRAIPKKLTEQNKGSPSVALWLNYLPQNETTSSGVTSCLVTRLTPMGRRVISSSSRWPLQIELYIIWLDFKSIKPHLFSTRELHLCLPDLWAQKWEQARPLIPGLGFFTFCEWCDMLRICRKKMLGSQMMLTPRRESHVHEQEW